MREKEKDEISEKELLALQVLPEYSWEMKNYIQGVLHKCGSPALTMYAAENMFQLDPPPPELDASGNHVALGGDLDGVSKMPEGFDGVQSWPVLADRLLARGLDEKTVLDIFWNNGLGVMELAVRNHP